jgi:hypothetical protein
MGPGGGLWLDHYSIHEHPSDSQPKRLPEYGSSWGVGASPWYDRGVTPEPRSPQRGAGS